MVEEKFLRIKKLYEQYTNEKFSMSDHENRLTLQKIICAVECNGSKNFDYSFGWYLRGPYSPTLASDGYHVDAKGTEMELELEKNEEKIADELKRDIKFLNGLRQVMGDEKNLELYSSILFLKIMEKRSEENIFNTIKTTKPWYDEEIVKKAIKDINSLLV
jgi:uncharacterized protein YwgA